MNMTEAFKEDINNSLKEIQENTGKQIESLKEKRNKSLKNMQENTIKQVKQLNKTIQDLKVEMEAVKKLQKEVNLEMES